MSDIVERLLDDRKMLLLCESDRREMAAEIERLRAALETSEAWIDRWTAHVGTCRGGGDCTCGRTAVLFEARAALPKP